MFSSPWDLVRPRCWYPMSSLEQGMMDLELMRDRMRRSRFPFRDEMLAAPSAADDDDFFHDLPVMAREHLPASQHPAADEGESEDENAHGRAFSSYSFSNSSVVDDKGQRVVSTRRRYEDSTGRLKAVHERQVEGKTLRTVWSRQNADDAGVHASECTSGSPEEFERLWQATPFGEAQKKTITHGQQHEGEDIIADGDGKRPESVTSRIEGEDTEFVDIPTVEEKHQREGDVKCCKEDAPSP